MPMVTAPPGGGHGRGRPDHPETGIARPGHAQGTGNHETAGAPVEAPRQARARRGPVAFITRAAREASLPLLMILAVFMGWLYAQAVTREAFLVSACLWALSAGIYVAAPRLVGFAFMVCEVLLSGLAVVVIAWVQRDPSQVQWHWVAIHGLFVGVNWLMWVTVWVFRDMQAAASRLAAEVDALRKTTGARGVLTRSEFVYQAQWTLTAMARRDESGFLLGVEVPDGPAAVALVESVGGALAQSVRRNFDLVGQVGPTSLAVLLQHTDAAGVRVVQERFHIQLLVTCTEAFYTNLRVTVDDLPPGASITKVLEQAGRPAVAR